MKVLIIAGYTPSLINFRGDLIKDIITHGHEVIASGPERGYEEEVAALGARFIQLSIERSGINPLKDIALISRIYKLIKQERPDVVLGYTIKPVIYGSIAARIAGVKNIYSMVTGLGYVFLAKGLRALIIRMLSKLLYSVALKGCNKVFFQNPDDRHEFIKHKLINKEKCVLINGSGVNLETFEPVSLPDKPIFLMICRILKDKGVLEYLEASRKVKKAYPNAKFQLLGPFDSNPNSLSYQDIKPYIEDDIIEYLGETRDVRPFLQRCSVYVLPSYREGTPRTVLEAMAMGRPVLTTDAPGCRETVIHGINGFLIPVKDPEELAKKMIWMIENKSQVHKMATESLRLCRQKYDVRKVNGVILKALGLYACGRGQKNAG